MTTDQTTPLSQYLRPLVDYRRLVALVVIGTIVVGLIVGLAASKSYTSTTSILVFPITGDPTEALEAGDNEVEMATELRVATSQAVTELVSERLGAEGIAQLSIDTLEDNVNASTTKESRILDIEYSAGSAELAQAGAAAFADSYLQFRSDLATSNKVDSEAQINARVVVLQEQLAEVTTRLNGAPQDSRVALQVQEQSINGELAAQQSALASLSTLSVDATRVIDPANLPTSPGGLSLLQVLVGAIVAGIVLGVVVAYVIAAFTGANRPHNRRIADKQTPQMMESLQDLLSTLSSAAPAAGTGNSDTGAGAHEVNQVASAAVNEPVRSTTPEPASPKLESPALEEPQFDTPEPEAPEPELPGLEDITFEEPELDEPELEEPAFETLEPESQESESLNASDGVMPPPPGPAPASELAESDDFSFDPPIPAALLGPIDQDSPLDELASDATATGEMMIPSDTDGTGEMQVGNDYAQDTDDVHDTDDVQDTGDLQVSGDLREVIGGLQLLGAKGPVVALCTGETSGATALATTFDLAGELNALGAEVLIIDAAVKDPLLHSLLRVDAGPGLSDVLAGRATFDEATHALDGLIGLEALTIGSADTRDTLLANLNGPAFGELLTLARSTYDLILLASTSIDDESSLPALAANADGLILSTGLDAGETISPGLSQRFDDLSIPALGVISTATGIAEAIAGTSSSM